MNKKKFVSIAKDVINLEIKALQSLKKNINKVDIILGSVMKENMGDRIGVHVYAVK